MVVVCAFGSKSGRRRGASYLLTAPTDRPAPPTLPFACLACCLGAIDKHFIQCTAACTSFSVLCLCAFSCIEASFLLLCASCALVCFSVASFLTAVKHTAGVRHHLIRIVRPTIRFWVNAARAFNDIRGGSPWQWCSLAICVLYNDGHHALSGWYCFGVCFVGHHVRK